ncbi:MAG: hypothetical protein K0M45_03620 [Candidatus Paracaedibacteraceae bacterium]|nr:hypothetical protein [Candidatus Paracaedibacteraceae bacterium]
MKIIPLLSSALLSLSGFSFASDLIPIKKTFESWREVKGFSNSTTYPLKNTEEEIIQKLSDKKASFSFYVLLDEEIYLAEKKKIEINPPSFSMNFYVYLNVYRCRVIFRKKLSSLKLLSARAVNEHSLDTSNLCADIKRYLIQEREVAKKIRPIVE